MKIEIYYGSNDVKLDNVSDPVIKDLANVIIKVSQSAICGSNLYLFDGCNATMEAGDILNHEFMGELVEPRNSVTKLNVDDRIKNAEIDP